MTKPVGVIGAGSFGITIAGLLSTSVDVLIYARKTEVRNSINENHERFNVKLSPRIKAVDSMEIIGERCNVIFPVIPSSGFRSMMIDLSPHINPSHILIHATKGLDLVGYDYSVLDHVQLDRKHISTMSEVIMQESTILRIGCMSGPNLAREIMQNQPAATVLASEFDEVIDIGRKILSGPKFFVFGSHDLKGAELAGAYKNIIALASGILGGMKMGKNIQSLLITKGLGEMIRLGVAMGSTHKAFLGIAGIGDLVATATSEKSRNYICGMRMGQGESVEDILNSSKEVIEGLRTLKIAQHLARYYELHVPITQMLYRIVYENFDIEQAIDFLMRYPYAEDVDFL